MQICFVRFETIGFELKKINLHARKQSGIL